MILYGYACHTTRMPGRKTTTDKSGHYGFGGDNGVGEDETDNAVNGCKANIGIRAIFIAVNMD